MVGAVHQGLPERHDAVVGQVVHAEERGQCGVINVSYLYISKDAHLLK